MTSSSYPMCYIIDGTAKVSDPIFFNATTSLELPLIFRIIFGIPDYFTALCSIQMIFPFCWKIRGGGWGSTFEPFLGNLKV